jgi:tetratricopeptide (TPR) repeat protein
MEDTECLERVLKDVEESYDLSVVEPLCRCYHFARTGPKSNLDKLCFETSNGYADFKHLTAACVIFLPCEIDCCPHELKYEMFRCQLETKPCRGEEDKWMDWAVLDSLSYLYFLQYKTYDRLGRSEEKKMALDKLSEMIDNEPNLGHKETALNLLGQCMEHENQSATALECYMSSLQVRRSNNAANIHICRLLNKIVMNHIQMK